MFFLREADDRVRIHLRHDQRHVRVVAPGRGIIDDDAALRADLRRPFLGDVAAGRHQADVGVGEVVVLERLDLQRRSPKETSVPRLRREASATTSSAGKAALGQDVQHFAAHIACGADDRDLETH